ncbi:MAG: hypothetical protein HYX68_10445 [Planctomycetes bacterium]|nr:hypothetical protein [Planctomycetota bacterium]
MLEKSDDTVVNDILSQVRHRVSLKRWLQRSQRIAWLGVLLFVGLFAVDFLFGMGTLALRVAIFSWLTVVASLIFANAITSWMIRLNDLGLAQLLEKRYPDLAERFVTLVQLNADPMPSAFTPLLREESERHLAAINPRAACPLDAVAKQWLGSAIVLSIALLGLGFVPAFADFSGRFFRSWAVPLMPIRIDVIRGPGFVLRGDGRRVEVELQLLDDHAEMPTECYLVRETDETPPAELAMVPGESGQFIADVISIRDSSRFHVRAGNAISDSFSVGVVDPPSLTARPTIVVTPPRYLAHVGPRTVELGSVDQEPPGVLIHSEVDFQFFLDRVPSRARIHVKRVVRSESEKPEAWVHPVEFASGTLLGTARTHAVHSGDFEGHLVMDIEHGLSASMPLGKWTVHEDGVPRFTQPIRLHGGSALSTRRDFRIARDDAIRLQTEIEDDEGLGDISIVWRINDGLPRVEKWRAGAGQKRVAIDDWLPLPTDLKERDRVRFRVQAVDNRVLRKGELDGRFPARDLNPQIAFAPAGDDAWMTLRVDGSVESFLKQQAASQTDAVRDALAKLKAKLHDEITQVEQLQRTTHQSPTVTQSQIDHAKKILALNQEIANELAKAAQQFAASPDLAPLADRLVDLATNEMQKSAEALQQFAAKSNPIAQAEKDLRTTQEALLEARKKLDGLFDWNKLLAQDRLDQFQIDKLAKAQDLLADRLAKLLARPAIDEAQKAKEIEAIRQEQARLAAKMAKLQEENKLVQEAMTAQQKMRADQLAQDARAIADQQRAGGDPVSASVKAQTEKLAARQADLANQVKPFAEKNQGPDVQPAQAAAKSLGKPDLKQAIQDQKEHEQRLQDWLKKLPNDAPKQTVDGKKVAAIKAFAAEQEKLRMETERLLADAMKGTGKGSGKSLAEKLDQLKNDLMELSQKANGPEAKAMAKETAKAIDDAKKTMEAGKAMKAKGDPQQAKKMNAEVEAKLDLVVKQLAKLSQDQTMKAMPKEAAKTAAALKNSADQMRKAQERLPTMPKDAQTAMKAAAKSLAQAAQQATKQMASKLPRLGRNPNAKASPSPGGLPGVLPKEIALELVNGKAWGQLPGELKTRMIQDYRARFGDDHAELIRQYFERLNDLGPNRKEDR